MFTSSPHRRGRLRRLAIALLAGAMALGPAATAQRYLALSTTLTTTREAARVYAQYVDLDRCGVLPGIIPLAGIDLAGALEGGPAASTVLAVTQGRWPGGVPEALPPRSWWTVLPAGARNNSAPIVRAGALGWREWAAATTQSGGDPNRLVLLGARALPDGSSAGKAEIWPWPDAGWAAAPLRAHTFAGTPVAAAVPAGEGAVVVFARQPGPDQPVLLRLGVSNETMDAVVLPLTAEMEEAHAQPVALAASPSGDVLYALVSGIVLGPRSGDAQSWLYALDAVQLQPLGDPVALAGEGHLGSLYPVEGGACWVGLHTPGSGFAQVTRVDLPADPGGALQKARAIPQGDVLEQVWVAPDPAAPKSRIVAAFDRRLLVWGEATGIAAQAVLENPVRTLHWPAAGLVVGEGSNLHRMDPDRLVPLHTVALPGGWIDRILELPARDVHAPDADCDGLGDAEETRLGSDPANADSDGDGLADGADPAPLRPTPQLVVPASVTLRGVAAGRGLRALPVAITQGRDVAWRVSPGDPPPPWLVIHPRTGRGPGMIYLGIDPARYRPEEAGTAALQVELTPGPRQGPVYGSPATVRIDVAPHREGPQQVLWMWGADAATGGTPFRDATDPHRLAGLGDLLAASPFLLSHAESHGPYTGDLAQFSILVLTVEAAAQGALTRQAVLDFVARGGALLFLGRYLGERPAPGLDTWLAPLGIQIDTSVRVAGRYAGAGEDYLLRHWKDFEIQNGCAIRAAVGHTLTPGGKSGGGSVLVAREYGYGRVALLAGPTPLESDALRRPEERRFALDLFRWLGRAGLDVDDADGDGIPDALEDRNDNGRTDPGETDYLNPDTDGDGLPDGLEDVNRNGEVDEGETDPRNPDTDGDGLPDGGDPQPSAVLGAPLIASVRLPGGDAAEGPAEGGTLLYVTGRGFSADCTFWIEDKRVPWQAVLDGRQVLIRTPGTTGDAGGLATVRVVDPVSGLEQRLPGGFRYTPRNTVAFEIAPEGAPAPGGGVLALRCTRRGEAMVGRLTLQLCADPQEGLVWGPIEAGSAIVQERRGAFSRVGPEGRLIVGLDVDSGRVEEGATLARWTWRLNPAAEAKGLPALDVLHASASTPYGGSLHVEVHCAPLPMPPPDLAP